jgi:pyruvate-ferredoxin/flavodoxin oxidoreductase
VAKFAHAGKRTARKDLALVAMTYGDVYVAQVALGGSDVQTVKALLEADAWPGPSLVIAYSSCPSAHGFAESQSMAHQRQAVRSGLWPLFRHHPADGDDDPSFRLDSHAPAVPFADLAESEVRFAALSRRNPDDAERLLAQAQPTSTKYMLAMECVPHVTTLARDLLGRPGALVLQMWQDRAPAV